MNDAEMVKMMGKIEAARLLLQCDRAMNDAEMQLHQPAEAIRLRASM